jgi:uncharacterized protein YjbI with pentapeptide repeats
MASTCSKEAITVEQREMHKDIDGNRVMLHGKWQTQKDSTKPWVTYERYPSVEYEFLNPVKAAKKILQGEVLRDYYIQALTIEGFEEAARELHAKGDKNALNFEPGHESDLRGKKDKHPVLKVPIICEGCIIGRIYLVSLILDCADTTFALLTNQVAQRVNCILSVADFSHTKFVGNAYFKEVLFSRDAHFPGAQFLGNADFFLTHFEHDVQFSEARFIKGATFSRAQFNAKADFNGANFCEYAHFLETKFRGEVEFMQARVNDDLDFTKAQFSDYTLFGGASILAAKFSLTRFDKTCDMTNLSAGKIDLLKTVFGENFLLSGSRDARQVKAVQQEIEVNLKRRSDICQDQHKSQLINDQQQLLKDWRQSRRPICGVDFNGTLVQGELRCDFMNLEPDTGVPILKPHSERNWDDARKQYSWLKEQYRKQGAYEDEDKAHWWASECARKSISDKRFGLRVLWFLYKEVVGYGVKPLKVIRTMGIVLVVCWLLYWIVGYSHLSFRGVEPPTPYPIVNAAYFSVITYATVGYGDVSPTGWIVGLAMAEGLLGVILNAALIVVIFRKLIR